MPKGVKKEVVGNGIPISKSTYTKHAYIRSFIHRMEVSVLLMMYEMLNENHNFIDSLQKKKNKNKKIKEEKRQSHCN